MRRKLNIKNKKGQSHTMGILLIYLVTSVFFFIGGYANFDDNSLFKPYVNVTALNEDNTIVVNDSSLNEFLGNQNDTSGAVSGTGVNIFDLGILLRNAINALAKFVFAVPLTLQQVGAPFSVVLLAGIIPFIMIIIGLMGFLRGKDL